MGGFTFGRIDEDAYAPLWSRGAGYRSIMEQPTFFDYVGAGFSQFTTTQSLFSLGKTRYASLLGLPDDELLPYLNKYNSNNNGFQQVEKEALTLPQYRAYLNDQSGFSDEDKVVLTRKQVMDEFGVPVQTDISRGMARFIADRTEHNNRIGEILSKADSPTDWVGYFGGAIVKSLFDPVELAVGLAIPGAAVAKFGFLGARSAAQSAKAVSIASVSGLAAASLVEPIFYVDEQTLQQDYSYADSFLNIAVSGILGGLFPAGHALGRTVSARHAFKVQSHIDDGLRDIVRGSESDVSVEKPFIPMEEDAYSVARDFKNQKRVEESLQTAVNQSHAGYKVNLLGDAHANSKEAAERLRNGEGDAVDVDAVDNARSDDVVGAEAKVFWNDNGSFIEEGAPVRVADPTNDAERLESLQNNADALADDIEAQVSDGQSHFVSDDGSPLDTAFGKELADAGKYADEVRSVNSLVRDKGWRKFRTDVLNCLKRRMS